VPPSASLLGVSSRAVRSPTGQLDHRTARRHPVKAKHSVCRSAPLAFRSAAALTWTPASGR
jgi:hypothetical protein